MMGNKKEDGRIRIQVEIHPVAHRPLWLRLRDIPPSYRAECIRSLADCGLRAQSASTHDNHAAQPVGTDNPEASGSEPLPTLARSMREEYGH